MTDALKPIVKNLNYTDIQFDYFTAPSSKSVTLHDGRVIHGISSINSGEDSAISALHCWPFIEPLIPKYDAFLVACYSAHPLVGMLKQEIKRLERADRSDTSSPDKRRRNKYVTGIFEASVATSLSLISSFQLLNDLDLTKAQATDSFGIVTTGSIWKPELSKAVVDMLGSSTDKDGYIARFAGVETTGLTAVELHNTPPDEVRKRISDATERLLKGGSPPVSAICLGCAGMAGMEEAVREGCVKAYGEEGGRNVRIIDGVVAGVGMLVNACKAGF